ETTTLLLFEATAVVMDKCFHLSDITPQYSSLWVSNAQSSESSVDQPVDVNELEDVNAYDADVESDKKKLKKGAVSGKMFGHVSYGLLSDSWWPSYEPDCGHISLFDHDWCNSIDVINYELLYLGYPGSRHSVPFSSSMEISMELIITTEMKDNLLLLCKHQSDMRFSEF
nr:arginine--tRNA ligase, chloroplastic/mitochondrial [Tanacetum cinerariifolium]